MSQDLFNILFIEDNRADARLLQELLLIKQDKEFKVIHVETLKEALAEISNFPINFDVIFLDLTLPDSYGLDSLSTIIKEVSSIPIVILTNQNDDELAIEAVSKGAQDYLVKRTINAELLYRSLNYAIERKLNQEALLKANQDLIDINERLEQEINERTQIQQKLAEKNKELEQFAYVVAHDLKQPLTTICGWLSMLESEFSNVSDFDPNFLKYFAYVIDATQEMSEMINVLLNYSRLESNIQEFQPVNCNDILFNTKEKLEMTIISHNVKITSDELPTIKGDGILLSQLFQNLIDNAIKYGSEKEPEINISAKFMEEEINQQKWLFSFTDNGIGIEPKEQKNIFKIFNRINPQGDKEGSGIGLATCEKIVKLHGGKIWVESTHKKGSTFFFTIINRTESG